MSFTAAETAACRRLIELALNEDFGGEIKQENDLTTSLCVPSGYVATAAFVARTQGILAGQDAAALVCQAIDPQLTFELSLADGAPLKAGEVIAYVRGPMASILGAERTALNFMQHLSGVASLTRQYVQAVSGWPVQILDTRKTTPGWRLLDKYAVRQGGGHNHRVGLFDGVLLKDNHLAFALDQFKGRITEIVRHARKKMEMVGRNVFIEIEVENLAQLDDALAGNPDIILLDNMPLEMMREAVARRNQAAPEVQLEASGGVNLHTVRAIAETGVDRISVGALTHSAPALDIALDYQS